MQNHNKKDMILDALQLTHELDFKVHQDKKIDVIRKKN